MGLSEIKKKLKSLVKILSRKDDKYKVRRFFKKLYINFLQIFFSFIPHKGVNVMDEKWDYLIILDACRFDEFKDINDIEGKLEKKISKGSDTSEWLRNNFKEYYDDVIYVLLSSFVASGVRGWNGVDHFFKFENICNYICNEKLDVSLPERVTNVALKIRKKYPNKRMIIHYPVFCETRFGETNRLRDMVEFGNLNVEKFIQAYRSNLKLIMNEVKKLIKHLDKKIVISADHGECFGEKFIYGHPAFLRFRELIEVPWLTVEKNLK